MREFEMPVDVPARQLEARQHAPAEYRIEDGLDGLARAVRRLTFGEHTEFCNAIGLKDIDQQKQVLNWARERCP
jgi:hypothetical protein